MYPVIDIHPSSPSLKRTQREANFLSRKYILQNRSIYKDRRQLIAVGLKNWATVVADSVGFLMMRKKEKRKRGDMKIFAFCSRASRGMCKQSKDSNNANNANLIGFTESIGWSL